MHFTVSKGLPGMIIALSFAAGFSLITVSCTPQQNGATLSDLILKCHVHINLRYTSFILITILVVEYIPGIDIVDIFIVIFA